MLQGGCAAPIEDPFQSIDTTFIRDYAETRGFSSGRPLRVQITPDGDAILFLRSGPRDVIRNLYEMNAETGQVQCLARVDDLLNGKKESLSPEERARRERMRESGRGLTWYRMSRDGEKMLIGLSGRLYVVDRADGAITELPDNDAGPARDARFSPDARYVSCIRGYDLYIFDWQQGVERRITTGGTRDLSHGVAEFVAQEEMGRRSGYWWSADSQSLAYEEADQSGVEMLYIADATHPERKPQGWRYPRAGTPNAKVRLGIVSVEGGETTWVDWDRKHFEYLAAVHWGADAPLTIYVQSRNQKEAVLYRVDPKTGATTELVRETDPAWINIDADMPRWIKGSDEFLWTSEREGQRRLELHTGDGTRIKILTLGSARLYGVVAVDHERREIIVSGATQPTETHLFRLSLDRGDIAALSEGSGSHAGVFSRNCNVWVHTASMKDGAFRQTIRGRDVTARGQLPSVAESPPFTPQLECTTVETGGRAYHAAIIRPQEYKPGTKMPVIVYVYGGPGTTVVHASARSYFRQQWLADQGFIVVMADGRGTPRRGRAWERVTTRNLIDAPLEDQAAVIQALGQKYPELDLTRVGIYGWSFGGYFSAMATTRRPDVFHAGVAGAPVIDWRDYDTHYTERYMDTPQDNPMGYEICNVMSYADLLVRPLLLIHGTTDDNVYFTHTLKMHAALFKAGRPSELLVLPGFTHMVPDPHVSMRLYERIARFFRKNLIESKPKPMGPSETTAGDIE